MNLKGILGDVRETAFIVIDLKDAVLTIQDGTTPTANSIEVKIGEGNLTYTESRNVEYILDRGLLDEVRLGDQIPMDIVFDFVWEYITGNTSTTTNLPTVEDALKQEGNASSWISTDVDVCRPYAVDLILTHTPSCATADEEILTWPDFRWDSLDHDLRAGTVAVTGRSNATEATKLRQAQP